MNQHYNDHYVAVLNLGPVVNLFGFQTGGRVGKCGFKRFIADGKPGKWKDNYQNLMTDVGAGRSFITDVCCPSCSRVQGATPNFVKSG